MTTTACDVRTRPTTDPRQRSGELTTALPCLNPQYGVLHIKQPLDRQTRVIKVACLLHVALLPSWVPAEGSRTLRRAPCAQARRSRERLLRFSRRTPYIRLRNYECDTAYVHWHEITTLGHELNCDASPPETVRNAISVRYAFCRLPAWCQTSPLTLRQGPAGRRGPASTSRTTR